MEDVTVQYHHC